MDILSLVPLKVDKCYVVKSDSVVTTTSGSLVDDPYAVIEFDIDEPRTVLVIYQAHNEYGQTIASMGRVTAVSVDGADFAMSHDSVYHDNQAARSVSFWVGVLGSGRHVVKGRFCSMTSPATVAIGYRVLIVIVFRGNLLYYTDDDTDATTTSGSLVDDPYASATISPPSGSVVLVMYNATSEIFKTNDLSGFRVAINVAGADVSPVAKAAGYTDYPLSAVTAYAFSAGGGQVSIKGRFASVTAGTTVTVSRRQLAVLVLDGGWAAFDYVSAVGHGASPYIETVSTDLTDDPGIYLERSFDAPSGVLLAIAIGSKDHGVASPALAVKYGISIDGTDVSYSAVTAPVTDYAKSTPAFFAMDVEQRRYTIRGRFASCRAGYTARLTHRYLVALWMVRSTLQIPERVAASDSFLMSKLPTPGLAVDGYHVPSYVDVIGRTRIDGILEDGTPFVPIVIIPPPPPPYREFITANTYPMFYITSPIKAQQIVSKVEGAAVVRVARDYPEVLIKRNRANELRSKF